MKMLGIGTRAWARRPWDGAMAQGGYGRRSAGHRQVQQGLIAPPHQAVLGQDIISGEPIVEVTVLDQEGRPMEGMTGAVVSETFAALFSTGPDGAAVVGTAELGPGPYYVEVDEPAGYEATPAPTQSIELPLPGTNAVQFMMFRRDQRKDGDSKGVALLAVGLIAATVLLVGTAT